MANADSRVAIVSLRGVEGADMGSDTKNFAPATAAMAQCAQLRNSSGKVGPLF
jgi:hypothetical protein